MCACVPLPDIARCSIQTVSVAAEPTVAEELPAAEAPAINRFSKEQQSALEAALRKHKAQVAIMEVESYCYGVVVVVYSWQSVPHCLTEQAPDRWDLIAAEVPGKSKAECIARCV
jgi:hypothetical protein